MYSKIGLLLLVILFTIGCESKALKLAGQANKLADQANKKADQATEIAGQAKKEAKNAKDALAKEKEKYLRYTKQILYTIACIVILRMVFRPLKRVLIAMLLRKINFKPRQIVPNGVVRE